MKWESAMESSEAGDVEPIPREAPESGRNLVPASFRRIQQWMQESRVPWTLVFVFVLLVAAKALVFYSLAWMLDAGLISGIHSNPYSPTDIGETSDFILALANRWDSQHFIEIARNGYPTGVLNDLLFAFAPVYPALIAGLNMIVGNLYLSGVIVSNIFYFLAVFSFYKVARLYMNYDFACFSALLFGLFPTFLVYGTLAYSEAPYLTFAIASWYFFKKEHYLPCAVLMTMAILTRYISGILFVIYGFILLSRLIDKYKKEGSFAKAFDLRLFWFAIPVASILVFFYYLYSLTGSFFVAFDAHIFFDDQLTTPFHQFRWFFEGFFTEINPGVEPMLLAVLRYMFTLPFLGLTIALFRYDAELGLYGALFMWMTLSMQGISGVASPRIMLSAWVALLAFKDRTDKSIYLSLALMFLVVSVWVLYQFERTFFA
jgi:hypothetical protein